MSDYILECKNVTVKRKKFELKDINFSLEPGFIYAIAGENGAGKSTLFKTIVSYSAKYSGEIRILGINREENRERAVEQVGFISEDVDFFGENSCLENAEVFGALYEAFSIDCFKENMTKLGISTQKKYDALSRGEKMKFQMAFAMSHNTKLYILDEATAGMDPVFRIEFFDLLRSLLEKEDCCVLMSSHNMTEIMKQTDYVAVMKDGKLGEFGESLDLLK